MRHFSDPTANSAIGSIDRQIRLMRRRAGQIRQRRKKGLLTSQELAQARKEFTGIYRRILLEALED